MHTAPSIGLWGPISLQRCSVVPVSFVLLVCAALVASYLWLAPQQTCAQVLSGPQATPWGREAQEQMRAACLDQLTRRGHELPVPGRAANSGSGVVVATYH